MVIEAVFQNILDKLFWSCIEIPFYLFELNEFTIKFLWKVFLNTSFVLISGIDYLLYPICFLCVIVLCIEDCRYKYIAQIRAVRIFLDQILRNIFKDVAGYEGQFIFLIFYSFFFFILFFNLIGLVPGCFCLTSQFFVSGILSAMVFVAVTSLLLRNYGWNPIKFLLFFIPTGVPFFLKIFICLIEIVSYISRVFSLAIRLVANMVAGHTLLHILIGALVDMVHVLKPLEITLVFIFCPLLLLIFVIYILEVGISFLQSYVFCMLFLIYLTDVFKHD